MEISEMNTEQLTDLYIGIAPALENITDGEHWDEIAKAITECNGNGARMAVKALPLLLKYNRNDIYTIIGAVSGKTAKEVAAQPFQQTLADAKELFSMDIVNFPQPSASGEPTA